MISGRALSSLVRSILVVLVASAIGTAAEGQTGPTAGGDSITIVPGTQYHAGGLHRLFLGSRYRDLWTTAIRVPKLDLATFGGGLTPTKKSGGFQTKGLRLKAADGRVYQFRSVDKDGKTILPDEMRATFLGRILQDQISSIHPAGTLVVPTLLTAAGVLHVQPLLVVMPDDPALGEYRAEFAGTLGTIEERPHEGDDDSTSFAGAKAVVSSEALLKRLDKSSSVRVDSREFLLARLTDVFLGDWDRHADQWRWALIEDDRGARWLPIPRDRDDAFARFDGLVLSLLRRRMPQLTNFGADYSRIEGATWNGRDLDRRLLTDLEHSVWDSVARVLQSRITDGVIDSAVRELPREYRPLDGPRLTAALRTRRDGIVAMAGRYYRFLAGQVDIHGSDQPDRARVTRMDDSTVEVTLARADSPGAEPYFRRRFVTGETKDIRIYLQGGDNEATALGSGSAGITVRFIGGDGNDRFIDSSRAGTTLAYDSLGNNRAEGIHTRTKPYRDAPPKPPGGLPVAGRAPAWGDVQRDWGHRALLDGIAGIAPDVGVLFGVIGSNSTFGFRKKPYASRFRYQVAVATGAASGRVSLGARFFRENSRAFLDLEGRASGIEVIRWHGFGNNTNLDTGAPPGFYRVGQQLLTFEPRLGWQLGARSQLTIGPYVSYSITDIDEGRNRDRFIHTDRPFGTGNFAVAGARAALDVDTRKTGAGIGQTGLSLHLGGSVQPKALDVTKPYGSVDGDVATYLAVHIPGTPTIALHGGAKKIWGTAGQIPFFDGAFLGSSGTLRGFGVNRFVGDAAVYGSAELRLHLTNLDILLPGQQGVFGFYDAGQVYLEGETSDGWHTGVGAGIWLGFLTPANSISAAIGHSDEGNRFYLRTGFAF